MSFNSQKKSPSHTQRRDHSLESRVPPTDRRAANQPRPSAASSANPSNTRHTNARQPTTSLPRERALSTAATAGGSTGHHQTTARPPPSSLDRMLGVGPASRTEPSYDPGRDLRDLVLVGGLSLSEAAARVEKQEVAENMARYGTPYAPAGPPKSFVGRTIGKMLGTSKNKQQREEWEAEENRRKRAAFQAELARKRAEDERAGRIRRRGSFSDISELAESRAPTPLPKGDSGPGKLKPSSPEDDDDYLPPFPAPGPGRFLRSAVDKNATSRYPPAETTQRRPIPSSRPATPAVQSKPTGPSAQSRSRSMSMSVSDRRTGKATEAGTTVARQHYEARGLEMAMPPVPPLPPKTGSRPMTNAPNPSEGWGTSRPPVDTIGRSSTPHPALKESSLSRSAQHEDIASPPTTPAVTITPASPMSSTFPESRRSSTQSRLYGDIFAMIEDPAAGRGQAPGRAATTTSPTLLDVPSRSHRGSTATANLIEQFPQPPHIGPPVAGRATPTGSRLRPNGAMTDTEGTLHSRSARSRTHGRESSKGVPTYPSTKPGYF